MATNVVKIVKWPAIFLLVFLFCLLFSLGTSWAEEFDGEQKLLQEKMPVNPDLTSGAFIYNFPVASPPGRNGMQPNLELNYSSYNNDNSSIFGYGWSSNIPYIERINREGSATLYSNNLFYSSLDGELVASSTTGGMGMGLSSLESSLAVGVIESESQGGYDKASLLEQNLAREKEDGSVELYEPIEVEALRSAKSKTFLKGFTKDGKKIYEGKYYEGHLHYFDNNAGEYKEINTELSEDGENWKMDKAAYNLKINKEITNKLFTFINQGQELNFFLPETAKDKILGEKQDKDGDGKNKEIIFKNALGQDIDLNIRADNEVVIKEAIIKNFDSLGDLNGKNFYEIPFYFNSNRKIDIKIGDKLLSEEKSIISGEQAEITDDQGITTYIRPAKIIDNNGEIENISIEYRLSENRIELIKKLPIDWLKNAAYPVRTDATISYYPGSGDGRVNNFYKPLDWSTTHDGANGYAAYPTDSTAYAESGVSNVSGNGFVISRSFLPFNTSALPDDATITSATLNIYSTYVYVNDNDGDDFATVVSTSQNSNTTLTTEDFDQCGAIHSPDEGIDSEDRIDISSGFTTNEYNSFPLNSTGIGWISKTDWTKLGLREGHDFLDHAYAGTMPGWNYVAWSTSESSNDPYLEITYTIFEPATLDYQDLSYTYDKVGNITKIEDNSDTNTAKTLDFTYDDLYRLTIASSTIATTTEDYLQTYAYNAIGNITNKSDVGDYTYTDSGYSNPNAVTSVNGTTYTYDNNGNLTSNGVWDYMWDYRNRLIEATNGTSTIRYGYDSNDDRVWMSVNGTATTTYPTKYFNIETKNNISTTTQSVFANRQLIATVEGNGIATSTYYIHTDHLGGSSVITNEGGELAELIDYYPFGDIRLDEKEAGFNEKRKFTGHEYDEETGLSYMGARYYPGNVARFISQDSAYLAVGDNGQIKEVTGQELRQYLSDPQNLNSYSYVKNNPLVAVDPNGKWIEYIIGDKNAVNLGNLASNNTVARYATDHPVSTVATLSIGGGAIAAGSVLVAGGSITCGILCSTVLSTAGTIANLFSSRADKALSALNNTENLMSQTQRQMISETIENPKLQNIFSNLYKASDKLPGGTSGAIQYEQATGKLMSPSGHLEKGMTTINGLGKLMQNVNLSQGDRGIAQTLFNQLNNAIKGK